MGEKKFPLIDQDQKCMKNTDKQGKCPLFTNVECQVAWYKYFIFQVLDKKYFTATWPQLDLISIKLSQEYLIWSQAMNL